MSALDLLLSRLPKPPRKAPARAGVARAFRAACPVCAGHGQPLSLGETQAGGLLLHCFGGCEAEDVLSALGLEWKDILPHAHEHAKGNGGPDVWGGLAVAVDGLHMAHCRLLAACSPAMQAGEIEESLRAMLAAGEAAGRVADMARRAMRGNG